MTARPQYLIIAYWLIMLGIACGVAIADYRGSNPGLVGIRSLARWLFLDNRMDAMTLTLLTAVIIAFGLGLVVDNLMGPRE